MEILKVIIVVIAIVMWLVSLEIPLVCMSVTLASVANCTQFLSDGCLDYSTLLGIVSLAVTAVMGFTRREL